MSHCAISQRLIFERKHFTRDRWLVRIIAFIILESGDNSGVDGDSALSIQVSSAVRATLHSQTIVLGATALDVFCRVAETDTPSA